MDSNKEKRIAEVIRIPPGSRANPRARRLYRAGRSAPAARAQPDIDQSNDRSACILCWVLD
jgi:hypothetical protein